MKSMVSLVIKLILFSFIFYPQIVKGGATDLVKQVVSNILKTVPQLEKDVDSSPKNEVVVSIINTGFDTFFQSADITQYSGVSDDNIVPFLTHLKKMTILPEKYEAYFIENLSMILYSDYDEIVVFNIMYDINNGGSCKYICIIANRDADRGTTDFLVGDIKAEFSLASQIMVVNETKANLFGILNFSNSKIIRTSPTINNEQIATLFKYFTSCIFKRFGEMLGVSANQSYLSDDNGFLQLLA